MNIIEYFSVNNDCYKNNVNKVDSRYTTFQNKGARGLMLHSVGCPQPSARVFANAWNRPNYDVAVHAVLQADGVVYQCLPWNFRGWHAGGSANNTHIGVEMTEPDCIKYIGGSTFTCSDYAKAKAQVEGTYKTAVGLFAMLCTKYDLDPMTDIISHKEGYRRGIASGHDDPEHLWTQLKTGYTMDTFRKAVKSLMNGDFIENETTPATVNISVKDWQIAAIADGFKFPKYGADGAWGAECVSVARNAVVMKRSTYKYKNLTRLVQKAVGATVDGLCGKDTDAAIREYQRKNGLTVDGVVGLNTWRKILGV